MAERLVIIVLSGTCPFRQAIQIVCVRVESYPISCHPYNLIIIIRLYSCHVPLQSVKWVKSESGIVKMILALLVSAYRFVQQQFCGPPCMA